eukprot:1185356-Prorocentrum_minimum.AAC.4
METTCFATVTANPNCIAFLTFSPPSPPSSPANVANRVGQVQALQPSQHLPLESRCQRKRVCTKLAWFLKARLERRPRRATGPELNTVPISSR